MGQLLRRAQLIEEVSTSTRGLWLIEAGSGYGKSVLVGQLRSACPGHALQIVAPKDASTLPGFVAQFYDAASAAGIDVAVPDASPRQMVHTLSTTGALLLIDNSERWDPDVLEHIGSVASDPALTAPVVLAGRLVEPLGVVDGLGYQTIGHSELAFTSSETAELLQTYGVGDPELASVLHQLTSGWPSGTVSAAEMMSTGPDPESVLRRMVRSGSMAADMLEQQLSTLTSDDRRLATVLAGLPFFDAQLAHSAGSTGALTRLRIAGLPINRRADGWSDFVPTFRAALVADQVPAIEPELVEYIASRGEIHSAINTFLAAGERERAARLLAQVTRRQETALDATELHAAVASIGDSASVAPRCLYVHSHVSAVQGHIAEGLKSIERAAGLFAEQDPSATNPAHIETLLTLGIWRTFDGELAAAAAIVKRCEPLIDWSTANENRALMHELRGLLHHQYASDADLERAAAELREGLAVWRQLDQPEAATVTLFRLAAGVLASSGRRSEALALLDQLPDLGPMTLLTQGRLLLERSWLLPFLGRADEVSVQIIEVRRIARLLDDKWLHGSSLIAEIVAVSFDYQNERVRALTAEALREGYITFVDAAEANDWVDTIEALARCGEANEADAQLELIQGIHGLLAWLLAYIEASLAARHGSASTAITLLEELQLRDDVERSERWKIELLLGYAHWRRGEQAEATKHLQASFDEAALMGLPRLPVIAERRIVDSIRGPAQDPATAGIGVITVFERFAVLIGGKEVEVPTGRVTTLLKLLVINGGHLTTDQAVDVLWPDADLVLGRRRLRNVVRRLRSSCGDVIVRDEDALTLATHVHTDFGEAVDLRKAADDLVSIGDAVDATDRLLLPDDRYDEWAIEARTALTAELVMLLDRLANLAESSGNHDQAIASLQRASALDTFDRGRSSRIERLLGPAR